MSKQCTNAIVADFYITELLNILSFGQTELCKISYEQYLITLEKTRFGCENREYYDLNPRIGFLFCVNYAKYLKVLAEADFLGYIFIIRQ